MVKKFKSHKLDLFIEILKDPDRKPIYQILYETLYLFLIYREIPRHYFTRYLFKKGKTNIRNYLPDKFLQKKSSIYIGDKKIKEILDNKLFFNLFYGQFNICLPKIMMHNYRKIFINDNKVVEVNHVNDFKVLLGKIFEQNPSVDSLIVKKTYSSSCGRNIFKLFSHQIGTFPDIIKDIFSEVIRSEYIFQETVKQHPVLDDLNPSCLNTIRFDTFIDHSGKAEIISGYLRMSIKNTCIDNISSGGCMVGTNLETGRLKKFGYASFKRSGTELFTEHPFTKTIFENFTIPLFQEAKEMVVKAAALMPGLRLVGWDIGIGTTGPVLIEGNSNYDIRGNDMNDDGYLSNPVFRKVLQEVNSR